MDKAKSLQYVTVCFQAFVKVVNTVQILYLQGKVGEYKVYKIYKCSIGLGFTRKHVSIFKNAHINKFGNYKAKIEGSQSSGNLWSGWS